MTESRRFEMALEIAQSPERVWRALTEAQELVRWFPLEAEVEPREGGRYFISWRNEWQGEGRIEIFEPGRHLRTTWPTHVEQQGRPVALAVDYHLEGRGGKTVLRLVHSGFGPGAEWDEEYDGISTGWNFELRSLRHYLEHHAGRDRHVAYLVGPKAADGADVWRRVWREGLGGEPPAGLAEGDRYELPAGAGRRFAGTVVDARPPRQFCGTVETLGDGLFRVEVFGGRVNLWLAAWDGHADEVARVEADWRAMLGRVFPAPASAPDSAGGTAGG